MTGSLEQSVRQSLKWSLAGNFIVRFGTVLVGIVLARLLTVEEFGVYAIALSVQMLLQTLPTAGLGATLVRAEDPERLAPTVATIALTIGAAICGAMALLARPAADLVGVPDAAPVIAVLSFTLLLTGVAAVPSAFLVRRFEQKKLFAVTGVEFVITTVCSIVLVVIGLGPLGLAIARIIAQSCSTVMLWVFSDWRPKFGFNHSLVSPALRFGVPAVSASFLSVVLINIDNVVIARVAGEVALGFYALAFNISNWPMSALGQGIKQVSLAAFSESARRRAGCDSNHRDPGLAVATTFAWAAALPVGLLLAVLAVPLIRVLYGDKWLPAAAVLAALGVFGALRVVFMLFDDYFLACQNSRVVMLLQVLWIVTLTPAMIVGTRFFGVAGGAWSHVIVCVGVMLPLYLLAAHHVRADVWGVVRALIPPILVAVPCWFVAHMVSLQFGQPALALICAGSTAILVYLGLMSRRMLRVWKSVRHDGSMTA